MGCDCNHCECEDSKKLVKVYFCPKCGSKEVGFVFKFANAFGVIPKMECKKCSFNGSIFPLLVVNKESLNKQNAKINKKVAHKGSRSQSSKTEALRSRKK
ncbi:MAG: hypothetical protein WCI72_05045 [archaeon]